MRLVATFLAAALTCGVAGAQNTGGQRSDATAKTGAGAYVTPMPELPAGHWGDAVFKDVKT